MNELSRLLVRHGFNQMLKMKVRNSEWKERILKEYELTKKLPRKKKKLRRKELELDYSIATYFEKRCHGTINQVIS